MKWFRAKSFHDGEWSYKLQSNVLLDACINPSKGAKEGRWLLTVTLDIPQLSIYRHYSTTYHNTVRDAMSDCRKIVENMKKEIESVLEMLSDEQGQDQITWLGLKKWIPLEEINSELD